jgi:arylsulfatase A-like enzyme
LPIIFIDVLSHTNPTKKLKKYIVILFSALVFISCKKENNEDLNHKDQHPNIIYILADDLGYGDVSSLNPNSKIKTVSIDLLADQGMSFTDAHSGSSLCTPTRYGILTGRYAWRTKLKKGVLWSYDKPLIDENRLTVASLLKQNGYNTSCIGKWHLGLEWSQDSVGDIQLASKIKNTPLANGFDEFYGIGASLDIPPYLYIKNNLVTATKIDTIEGTTGKGFWRTGPIGDDFKHADVLPHLTEKAIQYIDKQSNSGKPFFLYFPLPAPHTPILPTQEFSGKSNTNAYGDFVLMVDDVVKQIMKAVSDHKIEENTIIIFTSDNGSSPMADFKELESLGHFSNFHFRGHKADIYEGGHRIPFIVKWPKNIRPGSTSDQTICLTDLLATTAVIVGDSLAQNSGEDSFSIYPLITEQTTQGIREATIHHSNNGSFAIRQGKWKLIFAPGSGGWSYPTPKEAISLKLPPIQLYDLDSDIKELQNVAQDYPEVVLQLTELMNSYIKNGRSTPGKIQKNDTKTDLYVKL